MLVITKQQLFSCWRGDSEVKHLFSCGGLSLVFHITWQLTVTHNLAPGDLTSLLTDAGSRQVHGRKASTFTQTHKHWHENKYLFKGSCSLVFGLSLSWMSIIFCNGPKPTSTILDCIFGQSRTSVLKTFKIKTLVNSANLLYDLWHQIFIQDLMFYIKHKQAQPSWKNFALLKGKLDKIK